MYTYNAGKKVEVSNQFRVWAPSILKNVIDKAFKLSFCGCAWMHTSGCLSTNIWCKFMYKPYLDAVVRITHFVSDNVVMMLN